MKMKKPKMFELLRLAVLPARCDLCGTVVTLHETRCADCRQAARPKGKLCTKCGLPKEKCLCEKQRHPDEFRAFTAPYYFRSSIAKGVSRFKNYGYAELASAMAAEMASNVRTRFEGVEFDCVTAVPMRPLRKRRRGYNQAELLAKALSEQLNIPYEPLLTKVMDTPSQRYSTAKERRVNLRAAFDLAPKAEVDGKTVLLADDIKTTGSTLNACALTLRAYGAAAVYATAFAVVELKK